MRSEESGKWIEIVAREGFVDIRRSQATAAGEIMMRHSWLVT